MVIRSKTSALATRHSSLHSAFRIPHSAFPVLALFLVLSLVWTWPLALSLSSRIAHDPGDPLLNTWILWWSTQEIPFTDAWWNAPFFHPMTGALALSEHLAGLAPIAAPLMLAGVPPVAAYNITLLLTYALSGTFSYLLVRRLSGSTLAAWVAGAAFAFAPYRAGQLSHLQVLAAQWMPLLLLAMHAYLDEARKRWLVLAGACWVVQALSNGYYLLFLPVLVAMWLAWFVDWRGAPRRGLALVGTFALASVLLLPAVFRYLDVHTAVGLRRSTAEMRRYSPGWESFVRPPQQLTLWPDVWDTAEGHLFPGVTPLVILAGAGILFLIRRRRPLGARPGRSPLAFYLVAALLLSVLAMGPAPPEAGWRVLLHPYSLLVHLPGYSGLRVPARFTMLAVLCLTTAAGLGFARLAEGRRRAAVLLAALACAGIVVDGWIAPMPTSAVPGRVLMPEVPGLAVVEMPVIEPLVGSASMYRAIGHRRPLVTGYSGFFPPHIDAMHDALHRRDPSVLPALARGRPLVILIDDDFDPAHDLRELVEGTPGIEPLGGTSGGLAYLLPAQPKERSAPLGAPYDATVTLQPREHVVFDLGSPRFVRGVEFEVGDHYRELGGRVAIEASQDGANWTTVWEDWTGGLAVSALINDERVGLVRFPIADVHARYLRIHPAPEWMWRTTKIYGAR